MSFSLDEAEEIEHPVFFHPAEALYPGNFSEEVHMMKLTIEIIRNTDKFLEEMNANVQS